MKKINKKGFTLIELLAVIVVLAVIMVIATQQVNSAIKKSRGEAFLETVQSVRKSMQTVCATDNSISTQTLKEQVDNAEAITISVTNGSDGNAKVRVRARPKGKFANRADPTSLPEGITEVKGNSNSNIGTSYEFKAECPKYP